MAKQKRCARIEDSIPFPIQISGATIILFVVDLLFLLVEIPVWTSTDPNNPVWQTIRSLHGFGIFCFVVINILKLLLLVLSIRGASAANQTGAQ
jgi:hypothetical protein